MNGEIQLRSGPPLPVLVADSGKRARVRFLEPFAAQISNPHTWRAYARAAAEFLVWCESAGTTSLSRVKPGHVAAWIEFEGGTKSASTLKQRLPAIRHLFEWLVMDHIIDINPTAGLRGPRYVVGMGKTSVLEPAEGEALVKPSVDVLAPVAEDPGAVAAMNLKAGHYRGSN